MDSTEISKTDLMVNSIPPSMTGEEMRSLFSTFGNVASCKLICDRVTGKSLCYGFVHYSKAEDAEKAVNTLNGLRIQDRTLSVIYNRPFIKGPTEISKTDLMVDSIPSSMTREEMQSLFSTIGNVASCTLIHDKVTGESLCYGFVCYYRAEDAEKAVNELDGLRIQDRTLSVIYSRPFNKAIKTDIRNVRESSTQYFKTKFVPGSDDDYGEIFQYPYTVDDKTIEYIKNHGRIIFIIRGPPGTGKNTLADVIASCYPDSKTYSADNYFDQTYVKSSSRNPESLKASHEYCHKCVLTACQKDFPLIIVKNTHMKKFEVQTYVDYAATYNYTVIVSITTDKFKATPEILARSNSKGLDVDYLRRRLNQWQNFIPVACGWFLSPKDSSYLLRQLQSSIEILLKDGKFCRIFGIYEKEKLLRHYKARKLLYCIAACGEDNSSDHLEEYYLSGNVKDKLGQCFPITIYGYLVTFNFISAVVHLDDAMKDLYQVAKPTSSTIFEVYEDNKDSLSAAFGGLSTKTTFDDHCATVLLDDEFRTTGMSSGYKDWDEDEVIDVKSCCFIHLAGRKAVSTVPAKLVAVYSELLQGEADGTGVVEPDMFRELGDGYRVCRLTEKDAWFLKPPRKLTFESVFTGLYA